MLEKSKKRFFIAGPVILSGGAIFFGAFYICCFMTKLFRRLPHEPDGPFLLLSFGIAFLGMAQVVAGAAILSPYGFGLNFFRAVNAWFMRDWRHVLMPFWAAWAVLCMLVIFRPDEYGAGMSGFIFMLSAVLVTICYLIVYFLTKKILSGLAICGEFAPLSSFFFVGMSYLVSTYNNEH